MISKRELSATITLKCDRCGVEKTETLSGPQDVDRIMQDGWGCIQDEDFCGPCYTHINKFGDEDA
jgi:hypothetical protein